MSWKIIYSDRARLDLRNIYEYIAYDLLVPETAAGQTQRIMKEIRSLDEMPLRYRLYEEEPWHSQGVRLFLVDNYLVLYLSDQSKNTVHIVRIMYGGRDIKKQLSETEFTRCFPYFTMKIFCKIAWVFKTAGKGNFCNGMFRIVQ